MDKDAIIVNDGEKEAVDQPERGLAHIPTTFISRLTNVRTFLPKPADEKFEGANDGDNDDDDVDFGDFSTFDELLSASFTVPDKDIPVASSLEAQKSQGGSSSSIPTSTPIPLTQAA